MPVPNHSFLQMSNRPSKGYNPDLRCGNKKQEIKNKNHDWCKSANQLEIQNFLGIIMTEYMKIRK
jgi:hypothetical protein